MTWDEWATVDASCPQCVWAGKVTDAATATIHEPGSEVKCPLCGASILVAVEMGDLAPPAPDIVVTDLTVSCGTGGEHG